MSWKVRVWAIVGVALLAVIGVMVSLLMLQPDFGSSVILLSMMMLMLLCASLDCAL